MSASYFAIFRQRGRAQISRVLIPDGSQLPSAFIYEGFTYLKTDINLSNGDHLLDELNNLAGFTFLLGGDTEVGQGLFATDCTNVENESGIWLKFFLAEGRSYKNDCCQLICPTVYANDRFDYILLVEECPQCWRALAFKLASVPLPEAIF